MREGDSLRQLHCRRSHRAQLHCASPLGTRTMMRMTRTAAALAVLLGIGARAGYAQAAGAHAGQRPVPPAAAAGPRGLPALPDNLPGWLDNKDRNHIYF